MNKKIKDLKFYYDNFAKEVVLKKNEFAAPERYFEMGMTNLDDMYQDTWVDGDKKLTISYTDFDLRYLFGSWNDLLKYHLSKNRFSLEDSRLEIRRYPKKKFLEIISDYFNVDFENEELRDDNL